MMVREFFQIGAGAMLLCSPIWLSWLLVRWLDNRPTPAQRATHTRELVERRREQINRRGW
jgi:hypothetical protein